MAGVPLPERVFGHGFVYPIGTAVLRVAIGKGYLMALLVQPRGQVNGDSAFAHATFGVRDNDNHGRTLHHRMA